jgi:prepilin-type N-terminal cleavage/methylation domain-containing protein
MRKRNARQGEAGFTLIELMIAVAIIGLLSAIAIGPISAYMQRAKLTRTAADIQQVGEAWMVWSAMHGHLGGNLHDGDFVGPCPRLLLVPELEKILEMTIPTTDAFGQPIEYRADADPPTMLMIRSANSDGQFQGSYVNGTSFAANDRASDIVWFESNRVQWPTQ